MRLAPAGSTLCRCAFDGIHGKLYLCMDRRLIAQSPAPQVRVVVMRSKAPRSTGASVGAALGGADRRADHLGMTMEQLLKPHRTLAERRSSAAEHTRWHTSVDGVPVGTGLGTGLGRQRAPIFPPLAKPVLVSNNTSRPCIGRVDGPAQALAHTHKDRHAGTLPRSIRAAHGYTAKAAALKRSADEAFRGSGVMTLTVARCTGLPRQDELSSDPYVRVRCMADNWERAFKTRAKSNDLNPVYDETFTVTFADYAELRRTRLRFEVWDRDVVNADDLMGVVELHGLHTYTDGSDVRPIEYFLSGRAVPHVVDERELEIENRVTGRADSGHPGGTLHIALTFSGFASSPDERLGLAMHSKSDLFAELFREFDSNADGVVDKCVRNASPALGVSLLCWSQLPPPPRRRRR